MSTANLTRRVALLGASAMLGGCSAVSALNASAQPLDTYDLSPAVGGQSGGGSARTLLVARPEAPAALATDRIMIKPDPASITYLPDARWSDEAPLVLQALLIRSLSAAGRLGYVGRSDGGPVPDRVLLVRIDVFQVDVTPDGRLVAGIACTLTVLNDRDQRVIGSRNFAQSAEAAGDDPAAIVAAFQTVVDSLMPAMTDWVLARA
ncbi:MAG: ABC-type transport auxiliary lipoprotein family protein [Yoonia sp.]|uniref:ABC-type transport auxiliary lipoprotein family protein n=1 Tax=Yoonia sp. TaxID=2212373 RepID=UPI00273D03CE|nr:ABC-type transport auxiliary lipoprotein family protein [Yoonia sp.]MDP5085585.1 ABC-type transport auxiliary lipoprotein family protein [Yoonia sp.]